MSERLGFTDHRNVVTSRRSTEFIFSALGLEIDCLAGETVLDLGSGFNQQLAQDLEKNNVSVVSLDPNLPHNDDYVIRQLFNDLDSDVEGNITEAFDNATPALLREMIAAQPDFKNVLARLYREIQDWPLLPYGKAVAGKAQSLPFRDKVFDRIIASSSVPYGITAEEIPTMLAETNRVLKRGGKAHFWPVVVGGIEEYISLEEIRGLVKKARNTSSNRSERALLSGFGLEIFENKEEEWQAGMRLVGGLWGYSSQRGKTLVLTRKTD